MTTREPADHPVVLFDGVCNLCDGFVRFLIERDPEGVFRFAPLQSPVADDLLAGTDVDPDDLESVVLVEDGEHYVKSAAAIRAVARLGGIYRLLGPARYLPRLLRDGVYDVVADRRYAWFGKKDSCMVPTPDIEDRFLAGGPRSSRDDAAGDGDGGDEPDRPTGGIGEAPGAAGTATESPSEN